MNAQVDTPHSPAAQAPQASHAPPREKPLVPTGNSGAIEVFASAANFEQAWRMSDALSRSSLVPKDYQGNPSNVLIAINIASRVRADVFAVMQSLDIIQGRPSWRATFIIAIINSCGRFAPLQFHLDGKDMTRGCIAWTVPYGTRIPLPPAGESAFAFAKKSGLHVIEGPEVTMAMAKAEGWTDRNGSKWKTIPELMLRYRAASFFGRLNAPELMLGMHTAEEEEDRIIDITPRGPQVGVAGARALLDEIATTGAAQPEMAAVPDKGVSIAAVKAAKSLAELQSTYTPIVEAYVAANQQVPVELQGAHDDRKAALEQQQL